MRVIAAIALLVAICAPAVGTAAPAARDSQRKVVIVTADTATWADYASAAMPFTRKWLAECAVGLMNTRVATTPSTPAAYLTLGAGSRVGARLDPDLASLALDHDELYRGVPGHVIFRACTGETLPRAALAYLGLPSVLDENAEALYGLRPGLLGQALSDAGLRTAAIGNADVPGLCRRQIVTIVMNARGIVREGDIGPRMYRYDPRYEPPFVTDYARVLAELKRALANAAVVAVETGDLPRIAERRSLLAPKRILDERAAALGRLDRFMRELVGMMRGHPWRLYLVAPSAQSAAEERSDVLTPIAAYGEGLTRGTLTSPSTRRDGIVTNTDLAPSILDFLGLPLPADMVGRPMEVMAWPHGEMRNRQPPAATVASYVMRIQAAQERLEANRPYVLNAASVFIVVIFALTAMVLMMSAPLPQGMTRSLRDAALVVLAFPLAAVLLPADVIAGPGVMLAGVGAIVVVLYGAARALGRGGPPWAWLVGAFAVVVCADVASGQRLVQAAVLGYSATVGSRYYGLGNELGGALLAAAPIALAAWLHDGRRRAKRVTAILILAAIVILIGYPTMGANVGIAVPAALGFALMVGGLYGGRLRLRQVLLACLVALAAVVIIAAANWLMGAGGRSHIGVAVEAIRQRGWTELTNAFSRRFARNLALVRYSSATWVLVAALVVIAGAALGRSRALSERIEEAPALGLALTGAGVAAGVSFFVNDSGVAAAAWGFTLIAATMIYIVFDWRLRQGSGA